MSQTVTISREQAEELDAIRLGLFISSSSEPLSGEEIAEFEAKLAAWMRSAGFVDAFQMEWLGEYNG